ncbi:hypothetical protein IU433_15890 [Nocardia puris]|uniref:hypothetical protein n=1 Tax=Nocardia puris TaxID=208602 RepID=UPI0018948F18|nr:hypothetical protein [Nocardia puris]MBF6211833.1 hypothetical protein [Nocardia puris]MBF6365836.1 hypothetical protein [Nocardia puris]MBF6460521.1 hypothetical protein [Nocardia puris]
MTTPFLTDPARIDNSLIETGTDSRNAYHQSGPLGLFVTTSDSSDTLGMTRGLTLFEGFDEIQDGMNRGDPGVFELGVVAVGLEMAAMYSDPVAYVAGQIVSWMLEHIKPVREVFDKLAGNPDMIKAYSQSWTNIGNHVEEVACDTKAAVTGDTAKWEGLAANAYRVYAGVQTAQVASLAAASYGLAELTRAMGEIIGGVRTAVRDILAGIAGKLVSWTLKLAFSVGTATPLVISEAVAKIAETISDVSLLLKALAKDVKEFGTTAVAIRDLIDGLYKALAGKDSQNTKAVLGLIT